MFWWVTARRPTATGSRRVWSYRPEKTSTSVPAVIIATARTTHRRASWNQCGMRLLPRQRQLLRLRRGRHRTHAVPSALEVAESRGDSPTSLTSHWWPLSRRRRRSLLYRWANSQVLHTIAATVRGAPNRSRRVAVARTDRERTVPCAGTRAHARAA